MKNNQKIPDGWSVKKLGEISQVITGSTPQTLDVTNYGNEFLFVSPADINDNVKYITDTTTKLSSKGFSLCRIIKKGSPMFVCIGSTIGKTALAGIDLATNQQINSCIVKNCINNEFLYYNLSFQSNKIRLLAGEQAVPIINKSTFEKIKLSIPPLPEQEKIAEILGTWDKAIEKLSHLIEQKKLLKKGLMQRLLTGKVRLFKTSQGARKNERFSQPWKEVKLGEISERIFRKNIKLEKVVATISAQYGFIKQEQFFSKSVAGSDLSKYYLILNGEFGYNRSYSKGYPMGAIKRLDYFSQVAVSTLYICFKLTKSVNSNFMKYWFDAGLLNIELYKVAQEGARNHGLLNITNSDFFNTIVFIPSDLSEQQTIADVLTKADEEIDLLNKKLTLFKEQKKGLMQQLLTGNIRVKVN